MISISWWSFLIVLALVLILFKVVTENKIDRSDYGDSISSVHLSMAGSRIKSLIGTKQHVKTWIPIVTILGDVNSEATIQGKGCLNFLKSIK